MSSHFAVIVLVVSVILCSSEAKSMHVYQKESHVFAEVRICAVVLSLGHFVLAGNRHRVRPLSFFIASQIVTSVACNL